MDVKKIRDLVIEFEDEKSVDAIQKAIDEKIDSNEILNDIIQL